MPIPQPTIQEAGRGFTTSEIDAAFLRKIENEAIAGIISYREDIGLPVVTDGEFRRENWWIDFARRLQGEDILKRRLDEASKPIASSDLALNPQCGFARIVEANLIAEVDQPAEFVLVVETACEYWRTV